MYIFVVEGQQNEGSTAKRGHGTPGFFCCVWSRHVPRAQKGKKMCCLRPNALNTCPAQDSYQWRKETCCQKDTWSYLLSVPRCHSSEHFAMELTTFQHILEQRGLEGIAQRAQQHHADKWASLFRTGVCTAYMH